MSVGSIYEMFLSTYGWMLFNIVWDALVATGLAYLPFFAVIIDNMIKPIESQEAKAAATTSLRRLEVDIVRLIVIMMLAVSPYFSLNFGSVSHTKACTGQTVSAGKSGTVLDDVFNPSLINNQEAKVPPWFYIVMSVSGGINDAIIVSLPCDINIRQTLHTVNTGVITDDLLRHDLAGFAQQCYLPGIAWVRNERQTIDDPRAREDILWVGSKFLLDTYYAENHVFEPTPPFPFDPTREGDKAHVATGENMLEPEFGYPSCYEWWMDSEHGLRARLVKEFPPSLYQRVNRLLQPEQLRREEDAVLAKILKNDTDLKIASSLQSQESKDQGLGEYISGVVAGLGGIVADVLIQPLVFGVKTAAPLFQSMLLMLTYFLLPLVLLIGKYDWKTIMQATVFIFSVKFWTVIWSIIDMLDNKFFEVIKAASGAGGLLSISNQMILLKTIFDLMILSFYIAAPMFFMTMLSWAGQDRAQVANAATNEGIQSGKQAGKQGVDTLKG